MADNLTKLIAEMKAAAEKAQGVSGYQITPVMVAFHAVADPANVSALIVEIERQQLGAEAALRNAQLLDRIRLWSKCADGYPLDEHVNNIATKIERLERENERLRRGNRIDD